MSQPGRHRVRVVIVLVAALIVVALVVVEALLARAMAEEPTKPWAVYIAKIDEALGRRDISTAVFVWSDAYSVALGSRHWEGMLDVGDAYLRIGDASGFRKAYESKARRIYLTALFRARAQRSVDGVLRVAQAFAMLGDRDVVNQCIRVARSLAESDGDAESRARVLAFSARMTESLNSPPAEFRSARP